MKYTMKIFDNETGKLENSLEFDSIIAGFSTKGEDGKKHSGSLCLTADTIEGIGMAIHAADIAQQEIMKKNPMVGLAYMIFKNAIMDKAVKRIAQVKAMRYYGWTTEKFIEIFGRNYI
jgi:hypothetical protein